MNAVGRWPALRLGEWVDTRDTLHLWTQIVGKVRLALAPPVNHWWHVPLYVTARGLTTSEMPYRDGSVELAFDFIDDVLRVETSRGTAGRVALRPRSVGDFYRELTATLRDAGIEVRIWPHPCEIADAVPFEEDEAHASYDAEAVRRFRHALANAAHVLERFRGGFTGKCSPTHFFWGSFDLACTRFSGRRAPTHPGGIPNLPDRVTREAYSHECISAGWWTGGGAVDDAAFYAYAYPEPAGCRAAPIGPPDAGYHDTLREWILPYETVRSSGQPEAMVLEFLHSTYDVAAGLGGWDRAALERAPG